MHEDTKFLDLSMTERTPPCGHENCQYKKPVNPTLTFICLQRTTHF